jgi:hypothetical protein
MPGTHEQLPRSDMPTVETLQDASSGLFERLGSASPAIAKMNAETPDEIKRQPLTPRTASLQSIRETEAVRAIPFAERTRNDQIAWLASPVRNLMAQTYGVLIALGKRSTGPDGFTELLADSNSSAGGSFSAVPIGSFGEPERSSSSFHEQDTPLASPTHDSQRSSESSSSDGSFYSPLNKAFDAGWGTG